MVIDLAVMFTSPVLALCYDKPLQHKWEIIFHSLIGNYYQAAADAYLEGKFHLVGGLLEVFYSN